MHSVDNPILLDIRTKTRSAGYSRACTWELLGCLRRSSFPKFYQNRVPCINLAFRVDGNGEVKREVRYAVNSGILLEDGI